LILAACFLIMTAGCAMTPEQYGTKTLSAASESAAVGDSQNLRLSIDHMTLAPSETHRVAEFFAKRPGAVSTYTQGVEQHINGFKYSSDFARQINILPALDGMLPAASLEYLRGRLADKAQSNNLSSETPFMLFDKLR